MTSAQLRSARMTLGWTQQQLADALGVDVITVSRWERGVQDIPAPPDLAATRRAVQTWRRVEQALALGRCRATT